MFSGQLPPELYQEIVRHIQNRNDLLSLLTVSRLVSYEVERVLYRRLTVDMEYPERQDLAQHTIRITEFPHKERVAHHVQAASFSGVCSTIARDRLIPILVLLTNIRSLALIFHPAKKSIPFLDFLAEKVPFQLDHLSILGHHGDNALISFLRSQHSLTSLSWSDYAVDVSGFSLSPSDLPLLTTFISIHASLVKLILPGRNVRLLDYANTSLNFARQLGTGISFPSVQALVLPDIRDLLEISQLFPNLQYLEGKSQWWEIEHDYDKVLFPYLNLFKHLNILRLFRGLTNTTRPTTAHQLASKLFACHERLITVEISPCGGLGRLFRFDRGFEDDESLEPSGDIRSVEELMGW